MTIEYATSAMKTNAVVSLPYLVASAVAIDGTAFAFRSVSVTPIASAPKNTLHLSSWKHFLRNTNMLPNLEKRHSNQHIVRHGANDKLVSLAYDWAVNLGAPAALVAGMFLITVSCWHLSLDPVCHDLSCSLETIPPFTSRCCGGYPLREYIEWISFAFF